MNSRKHINPALGKILIKDLRPEHIQRHYNSFLKTGHENGKNGLSPKTNRNIHNILHDAFHQALKNSIRIRNDAEAGNLPKRAKAEIRIFLLEDHATFL